MGAFLVEFRKNFIPAVVQEQREEEFMNLKQRSLTVAQYEMQFTKLSKYTPEMVNTDTKRKKRFPQGLDVDIQDALVTANIGTYVKMVEMAQRIENSKTRVREFHSVRRSGPKPWVNQKAGPSQGPAQPPQRAS